MSPCVPLMLVLLAGCAPVAGRPCPRVTEFPAELQTRAAEELDALPRGAALAYLLDALVADRAFNRAICAQNRLRF